MQLTSREVRLFNPDPAAYLPHANPFLFIDRVLALEKGVSATGVKAVTHDPAGYPLMLLIESIAQLAGIAVAREKDEGGFIAGIDRAEFSGRISAGDRVMITVRVIKSFGRLHLCEGEATVEGERVASAALTLGIGRI